MITKERILELIHPLVESRKFFIVLLEVSVSNKITLHVDSMKGVRIDECVELSKAIEQGLDRENEDFEIEVSSAGLSAPFSIREQYLKNINQEVSVLLPDGRKEEGKLIKASEDDFSILVERRVKVEGKKKKQLRIEEHSFKFEEVNKVKLILNFK